MSFKVENTAHIARNGFVKFVVYGPPKIGKTTLAATWPNTMIISTERGLLSLRKFNVPYIQVDDVATLREAGEWIYSSAEAKRYRNLLFDSASDIGEVVLSERKKKFADGRKAYGEAHDEIMSFWRAFRDVPDKNVCFIAKEVWEEKGPYQFVRPSMPSAYLTQQLPYMFDGIFRMSFVAGADGVQYRGLRCHADPYTTAGDRSGTLAEWEPPDLSLLVNKMLKG